MGKYFKLSVIIIILALTMVFAASAGEWETYDYSRFNNSTYLYDIGNNFKNTDIDNYNNVLKNMQSDYGITYTFIIVDDYTDNAWDLAALIREKAGYGNDYISVVITTDGGCAIYTLGKGQKAMNDDDVNKMLNALRRKLTKEDYDGALVTFIDLAKEMSDTYSGSPKTNDDSGSKPFDVVQCLLWVLIGGIVVALILTSTEMAKHRPVKKALTADFYVEENNVRMSVVEDRYLRSHETRTKVNNTSSGGGSRGGGSTRTGSSGRSGGGGSIRFK